MSSAQPRALAAWSRIPTWLALFVLGLSVYLLSLPADLRNNGDTTYRFDVTQALVQTGTVFRTCPAPGSRPPTDTRLALGRHGCYYTIYAPGQSVFMVPLYSVGKVVSDATGVSSDFSLAVFARALDSILGALILVIFFLLAIEVGYSPRTSVLLTLILGFASTLWPDVQSGQEHTQVTLFLLLSVYAILCALKRQSGLAQDSSGSQRVRLPLKLGDREWLVIAGAAAGLGIFTRYDFAIYALVLAGFLTIGGAFKTDDSGNGPRQEWARSKWQLEPAAQALAWFGVAFLPFVLLDGIWNSVRFGAPLRLGQSVSTQFGFPIWQGIPNLLVSPAKGLIWYLPLVWFLPLAVRGFARRHSALAWLSGGLVAVAVIFYANLIYWHGDPAWGPRYLFPIVPFLVLPLGVLLERFRSLRLSTRSFIVGVLGLSLALQIVAVGVDPWRFWYRLIQYRQQAGQVFRWDPGEYNYYWSRNSGLDPELYQFVSTKDVVQIGLGHRASAIPEARSHPTCVSSMSPRAYDACQLKGVSLRDLNTISPIWLNDRYQWFNPEAVPLSLAARAAIVGILVLGAGLGAGSLLLQFRAELSDESRDV